MWVKKKLSICNVMGASPLSQNVNTTTNKYKIHKQNMATGFKLVRPRGVHSNTSRGS